MIEDIYSSTKENMSKSIESLGRKFTTIRTGKVNTAVLDNISIDYYGNMTPISQVANIGTLDATTISIDPFDKSLINYNTHSGPTLIKNSFMINFYLRVEP